jgi:prepilin-type N-terminal cleavage/methylation domain-containing protein
MSVTQNASKAAGFTLAEVLIAVAVLAVAATAVISLFLAGTKLDAAGTKHAIAQAAAQLRMEALVGQTAVDGGQGTADGFPVDVTVNANYMGFPGLAHVTVTVYDADGVSVLYTLENVLNVIPGGIPS